MAGKNRITVAPGIATLSKQLSSAAAKANIIERDLLFDMAQQIMTVKSDDLTVMKQKYEAMIENIHEMNMQIQDLSNAIARISKLYKAEQEEAIACANLIPK